MIQKILIANRGEIACRIIKTAKKLEIKTVAVFSAPDQDALHVNIADEAYRIGPANATKSYLNIDNIIKVAKQTNSNAIHPGYGFLSENAEFAKRCEQEKIIFIGPPADAITAMGSKSEAKNRLAHTKVPLIPGYHGPNQKPEHLFEQAQKIGFPVLIKAASGGGGKGMRVVNTEEEFIDALASCQREAKASFSDDEVLLEKYFTNPRHVEMQIFADQQGNVVHLFERDCSIQRRHQKIIEEAPAPNIKENTRKAMADAAIAVAQSINYIGAGTVEFLMDEKENFYFMEMNTRLQVEHPVTEMITGLDLVEWQIKIANGGSLPLTQSHIKKQGHAIEARIYAEDPDNQFAPSIGQIAYLGDPPLSDECRIDTGFVQGDVISPFYDPMIAKLIVWAETRELAIEKLSRALRDYHLIGIKNNVQYLQTILKAPDFINAKLSTNFITEHQLQITDAVDIFYLCSIGTLFLLQHKSNHTSLWQTLSHFRLNIPCQQTFYFKTVEDTVIKVIAILDKTKVSIHINDTVIVCQDIIFEHNLLSTLINKSHNVDSACPSGMDALSSNVDTHEKSNDEFNPKISAKIIEHNKILYVFGDDFSGTLSILDPGKSLYEEEEIKGHLTAPMPGNVIEIKVKQGAKLNAGDALITLEAMKMEHTIIAPFAGIVEHIYFNVGDLVSEGDELIVIEPEE